MTVSDEAAAGETPTERKHGEVRRTAADQTIAEPHDTVAIGATQMQPTGLLRHAEQREDVRQAEGV
jgi:hypothetical protein